MGSSTKKKAEKKKDFKKEKLKVGKQKPKPTNLTDTSFRAKGIVLREQRAFTLSNSSSGDQFTHHLSLISSRSDSQRRDSLSFLATFLAARAADESLPQPAGTLLSKFLPLTLDGSDTVRAQLLRALRAFRADEARDSAATLLLYARTGMTHLAAGIRDTAMDVLAWALRALPAQLVACAGGWTKTLRYFALMLGWAAGGKAATVTGAGGSRLAVKVLATLGQYLRAGLVELEPEHGVDYRSLCFPLADGGEHRLPTKASPYAYLGLFRTHQTDEDRVCQERAERQAEFARELRAGFAVHLAAAKKEGGDMGRVAGQVEAAVAEGMADFEQAGEL